MSYLDELLQLTRSSTDLVHPLLHVHDTPLRLGQLKFVQSRRNKSEILEKIGAYPIQLTARKIANTVPIILPYKKDGTLASLNKVHINSAKTEDDIIHILYDYCDNSKTKNQSQYLDNLFHQSFPIAELPVASNFKLNLHTFTKSNVTTYQGDLSKTEAFSSNALTCIIRYETNGQDLSGLRFTYWCHQQDKLPRFTNIDNYLEYIIANIGTIDQPQPLKPKYAKPTGSFILSKEASGVVPFGVINLAQIQTRNYTQTRYLFPNGSIFAFNRDTLKEDSVTTKWDPEATFKKIVPMFMCPVRDDVNTFKYGRHVK